MNYPGGKNGSGVYQKIISLMPPHKVYIEPFLGSGAIMRFKKPAPIANIGIDLDQYAIDEFSKVATVENLKLICANAIEYLKSGSFQPGTLVYCDPPYLMDTRSSKRMIYRYEMTTGKQHGELLDVLKSLPCMVMVSGYPSELYASVLAGWRMETFNTMTRGGKQALECVWCNFEEPLELHDYRYLGEDYRERERIKKKQTRWKDRLKRMPAQERYAILAAMDDLRSGAPS